MTFRLLGRQESRLEEDSGRKGRQQRQGHQLAHARCARVMRETQAAERDGRRAGAEEDGARQARLQEVRFPRAPRNDVVDLEGDADAEKKRQCDDVGEIELQPDEHADLEGDDDGNEQGYQRQGNIHPAAQGDKQDQRNQHQ